MNPLYFLQLLCPCILFLVAAAAPDDDDDDDDDDDADDDGDCDATPAAVSGLQIWHEIEITIICIVLLALLSRARAPLDRFYEVELLSSEVGIGEPGRSVLRNAQPSS